MTTLGKRIAHLRKINNLTQQELAEKINVSDKTISKWENDLSLPGIDVLPELVKVLSTNLYYIISGEDELSNERENVKNNELLNINYGYKISVYSVISIFLGLLSIVSNEINDFYAPTSDLNEIVGIVLATLSFSGLIYIGVIFNNFYLTSRKIFKISYKEIKYKTIFFMTLNLLLITISSYILICNFLNEGIIWIIIEVLILISYIILLKRLIKQKD